MKKSAVVQISAHLLRRINRISRLYKWMQMIYIVVLILTLLITGREIFAGMKA